MVAIASPLPRARLRSVPLAVVLREVTTYAAASMCKSPSLADWSSGPLQRLRLFLACADASRCMCSCNDGKAGGRFGETDVDCGGSCADDLDQLCVVGNGCRCCAGRVVLA